MWLKQSTAFTELVGPILDSLGAEYTSAVIGDLTITKNGTSAAMAAAATLTHVANGYYTLAGTTGNSDTLGRLTITCNKSTYQMPPHHFVVMPATVFDALVTNAAGGANGFLLSDANNRVDIAKWLGTAPLALSSQQVQAVVPDTQKVDLNTVKTQTVTAASAITFLASVGTAATSTAQTGDGYAVLTNVTYGLSALKTLIDTIDDFIDTEVAAIKAKTDNLPSDPADASDIAASFSTLATTLSTIAGYIDTEVAAIKAKTDNLPSDPADASDIASSFSTVNSTLTTIAAYIDTEVAAIKAKTDNLPASPAATGDAMALTSGERTAVTGVITTALFVDGATNKLKVNSDNSADASVIDMANNVITDAVFSTPAEASGRPTTILAMIRRIWERTANKRTRDRSTGTVLLRNAADNGTLETQIQSTSGSVDTQSKGT